MKTHLVWFSGASCMASIPQFSLYVGSFHTFSPTAQCGFASFILMQRTSILHHSSSTWRKELGVPDIRKNGKQLSSLFHYYWKFQNTTLSLELMHTLIRFIGCTLQWRTFLNIWSAFLSISNRRVMNPDCSTISLNLNVVVYIYHPPLCSMSHRECMVALSA